MPRRRSGAAAAAERLGGLAALDGRLAAADLDGHAARLALLGLGGAYLEHALVKGGGDAVGVDAFGQGERAAELAERALQAVEALALVLVLGLALAGDGEDAVLELDAHVLLGQAGEVGAQDEVIVGLDEVHGRQPAPQRP